MYRLVPIFDVRSDASIGVVADDPACIADVSVVYVQFSHTLSAIPTDKPKSAIFTLPTASKRTLEGFRSSND